MFSVRYEPVFISPKTVFFIVTAANITQIILPSQDNLPPFAAGPLVNVQCLAELN
jgi:hypothetical protein